MNFMAHEGSQTLRIRVIDVFTHQPFLGNPVAVVLDAAGLDTETMQRIACWTNLSETTFVLPATQVGADYRLRIFTPQRELPYAGHPTLGSAHAVVEAGLVASHRKALVQECGAGLINIQLERNRLSNRLTLTMPPAVLTPLSSTDVAELEAILGQRVDRTVEPAIVNVGPVWVVAQLPSVEALLSLTPDYARSAEFERRLSATGLSLYGLYGPGGPAGIEVRSFVPSCGIDEDPVCGSGNGSIAAFRFARGLLSNTETTYVAAQGRCVGREGRVFVSVTAQGHIGIGGECVTCVKGELAI